GREPVMIAGDERILADRVSKLLKDLGPKRRRVGAARRRLPRIGMDLRDSLSHGTPRTVLCSSIIERTARLFDGVKMPRFAANLSMMFWERSFLERFAAARKAAFAGVEFLFPYVFDKAEILARRRDAGLAQILINTPPGHCDAGA